MPTSKGRAGAQATVERDFQTHRDNQVVQAPTGTSGTGDTGAGSGLGLVGRVEAPKPAVTAADAGLGDGDQRKTKVDPTKEACVRERSAAAQMPAFDAYSLITHLKGRESIAKQ